MSTYDAQEFQAKNKLTGYISRLFNGQSHVKITDGVRSAEASSSAGEADAARKALKALRAPVADGAEPEDAPVADDDPVTPVEPEQVPVEGRVSEAEARDLHPAGADLPDLPPPPPFPPRG